MEENIKENEWYKAYKKVRKDWGNVNPVEKVVPSKKEYKRSKDKRKLTKYLRDLEEEWEE